MSHEQATCHQLDSLDDDAYWEKRIIIALQTTAVLVVFCEYAIRSRCPRSLFLQECNVVGQQTLQFVEPTVLGHHHPFRRDRSGELPHLRDVETCTKPSLQISDEDVNLFRHDDIILMLQNRSKELEEGILFSRWCAPRRRKERKRDRTVNCALHQPTPREVSPTKASRRESARRVNFCATLEQLSAAVCRGINSWIQDNERPYTSHPPSHTTMTKRYTTIIGLKIPVLP